MCNQTNSNNCWDRSSSNMNKRLISSAGFPGTVHVNSIDRFEPTDVYYHWDVLTEKIFSNLVNSKGYPYCVVEDSSCHSSVNGYNILAVPLWLKFENQRLLNEINLPDLSSLETNYAFNFCINKKQINRYLLMKLVEIFDLPSYDYTWSGIGKEFDIDRLLEEADQSDKNKDIMYDWLKNQLGVPISLQKKFIDHPSQQQDHASVYHYGSNSWTWNHGLNQLFSQSAISLISESVGFENASVLSEKTLYSIYGLTMPIWIGGYGIPDAMEKLGFDTFSDIIDHSYQYKSSLFERCYQAFRFNQHLLRDVELLKDIRRTNIDRLLANRESLKNGFFERKIQEHTSNWPDDIITMMNSIGFFHGNCHR